jgi:hypothetical protein
MFVFTLEDYAQEWFNDCSPREISSFLGLIKAFQKFCDPSYEEVGEQVVDPI